MKKEETQITLEEARSWYPQKDPVHGFDHVERVMNMAVRIAKLEGADVEIVRAAALLHDAQGSHTAGGESGRSDHHEASAEFADQILSARGWDPERIEAVKHCIRAHRFRNTKELPQTQEAKILFDADKLDVIGAIGVARTIAFSAVVGQPFFVEPSAQFVETGEKIAGELHSSYHEYLFKLQKIKSQLYTSTALAIAEDRYRFMDAYFVRLVGEIRGEL